MRECRQRFKRVETGLAPPTVSLLLPGLGSPRFCSSCHFPVMRECRQRFKRFETGLAPPTVSSLFPGLGSPWFCSSCHFPAMRNAGSTLSVLKQAWRHPWSPRCCRSLAPPVLQLLSLSHDAGMQAAL
ncbi:hypothetical protein NDU88_010867 [Pleurodeles waltl]|uniref:Uncharacterized protein n=1 Tax=Pleurodeles waltl TaxID=8319 RepID=A0AAV7Q1F4_PLEWA|nr:hypothetical protein NDU88_010867 [Pleurodeles waltl]